MENIKTTQGQILTVMTAIGRIRQRVKGHDALNLFHLKNVLQEHVEFQADEERRLVDEYGGKVTETGVVLIADDDKRKEFQEEYKKLLEMEVEVNTGAIVLPLDRNPEITLEDIEQLNGFIIFK